MGQGKEKVTEIPNMNTFNDINNRFISSTILLYRGLQPTHGDMMKKLIAEAVIKLLPTHYLVTEMYVLLSTIHALGAAITEKLPMHLRGNYAVESMRIKSAQSTFKAIKTIECCDNLYVNGITCDKHSPSSHCIH